MKERPLPKEIHIPFIPEMKKATLEGKKICTSRYKRYGKVDDTFMIDSKIFVLTNVWKIPYGKVAIYYYKDEGFNSQEEFEACWKKIHPRRKLSDSDGVWVHHYKIKEVK